MNIYANEGLFNADILQFDNLVSVNKFILENCEKLNSGTVVCSLKSGSNDSCARDGWYDEFKSSTLFSILIKSSFVDEPSVIPLIAGIAICETIFKITGKKAFMKWPGEIILENRCVGKFFGESKITPHTVYATCSIGVNINTTQHYFDENQFPYATSLFLKTAKIFDEMEIIKTIISEFEKSYLSYKILGFGSIKPLHIRGCITLTNDSRVAINGETILANVTSIKNKGQLICRDNFANLFEVFGGLISTIGYDED